MLFLFLMGVTSLCPTDFSQSRVDLTCQIVENNRRRRTGGKIQERLTFIGSLDKRRVKRYRAEVWNSQVSGHSLNSRTAEDLHILPAMRTG